MKRIISTLLVCVLLLGCVFTLASCGKMLTGKYQANVLVAELTYEFGAFGKVTLTVDPVVGNVSTYEGKYKFTDAGDEITFTFEDEGAKEYNGTVDFTSGTEGDAKYIKLNGVRYDKVD